MGLWAVARRPTVSGRRSRKRLTETDMTVLVSDHTYVCLTLAEVAQGPMSLGTGLGERLTEAGRRTLFGGVCLAVRRTALAQGLTVSGVWQNKPQNGKTEN